MVAMVASLALGAAMAVGSAALEPMNRGDYRIANALDPQGHDAKMHFRGEFFEVRRRDRPCRPHGHAQHGRAGSSQQSTSNSLRTHSTNGCSS